MIYTALFALGQAQLAVHARQTAHTNHICQEQHAQQIAQHSQPKTPLHTDASHAQTQTARAAASTSPTTVSSVSLQDHTGLISTVY